MELRRLSVFVCALLALLMPARAADFASLKPEGYVSDYAQVIDAASRASIEQYCAALEAATGAQIAVLTVPSLQGEPLEDVAHDVFNKWGVGKKGKDEGVLLLLATQDRRMRLEIGYGLEAVLPDGFDGSVLRSMRPGLRESRYSEAVAEAVRTLGTRIAEDKGVQVEDTLPRAARRSERASRPPLPALILVLFVVIWLLAAIGGNRGRGGRFGGSGGGGDILTGMLLGGLLGRSMGSGRGGGGGGFGGFDSGGGFGGFGGFGGGGSGGGGASGSW